MLAIIEEATIIGCMAIAAMTFAYIVFLWHVFRK